MVTRQLLMVALLAGGAVVGGASPCSAQCCLSGLFAGCQSCFKKAPPAYAVAPAFAPVPAPVPVPAPPPPVMVPVQQVSYVPETTYQTKYQCVPVTTYKPSCEIDPCTGCPVECMQPVTSYQNQPVSVPVTQYRAVYSTKYVQMQPGYTTPTSYPAAAPGASPFAAPVQTSPQAWGAAGADVPQQLVPGQSSFAAPALPPQTAPQSTFQQVVPQSGTYATPAPQQPQLQPTAPPALAPTPSLRPIPELPRTTPQPGSNGAVKTFDGNGNGTGATGNGQPPAAGGTQPQSSTVPSLSPIRPSAAPAQGGGNGATQMPVLPGSGPGPATGAFPKLLEPTGHTTQMQPTIRATSAWHPSQAAASAWQPRQSVAPAWQPAVSSPQPAAYASGRTPGGYPTAALPIRSQQ
jgi:hypothetical protein